MQRLHAGGDHDLADIEAAATRRPSAWSNRSTSTLRIDTVLVRLIDDPDAPGCLLKLVSARCRNFDDGDGVRLHARRDGGAEPHLARADRSRPTLTSKVLVCGLACGRDLADAAPRRHLRIVRRG